MTDTFLKQDKVNVKKAVVRFFYSQAMLLVLIILFVIMSFVSDTFLTLGNFFNVIRGVTVLGIMACGMTIVIIGKGVDLSAAAILGLCAVVNVMMQGYGYWPAALAAIAVGLVCGLFNGFLIGKIKANFIIVTLGTQLLFTAIALLVSAGRNLRSRPERIFSYIGKESILGVPVMAYLLLFIFIISGLLLHKTIGGRRLFAVGLNDKAALVAGINVSNVQMISYTVMGLYAGLASLILTARLPRIRVGTAGEYLFDIITVVVLGGTALSGGVGGIYKTVIGLAIFALIRNGMALLATPYEYQQMITGIILILAVLYDEYNRRKRLLY
ncbi:MAG: ABC transporter permease [Actinomycetota bacterium]